MIRPVHLTLLLSACLLLAGCATSLPKSHQRPVSTAFADPETTELGLFFESEMDAHPGKSGIIPVTSGEWGFRARTGLANQAEQTIDVQYYIWETDTAGSILVERGLISDDQLREAIATPVHEAGWKLATWVVDEPEELERALRRFLSDKHPGQERAWAVRALGLRGRCCPAGLPPRR